MQNITREARRAAAGTGFTEVDIVNFSPTCVLLLYPDMEIPAVRKYTKYTAGWEEAVS